MPTGPLQTVNLGISRQLAVTLSIASVVIALLALMIGASFHVIDAGTVAQFVATLGVVIPALVAALKSTEAADTASKVNNTVQFTASQHATLLQMVQKKIDNPTPPSGLNRSDMYGYPKVDDAS